MTRFLTIAWAVLLCLGASGQALAQDVAPQSAEDALFALGSDNDKAISALQNHMIDQGTGGHVDYAVWCSNAVEVTRLSQDSYRKTLTYLKQMQSDGKTTAKLERTYLSRSDFADAALIRQYQFCARGQFADDYDAESADQVDHLLAAYENAKADNASARASQDRLVYISRLQTMHTLMKKVVELIDMYGRSSTDNGPKTKAILARAPALRGEYAAVHQKYQGKIAPLLHPGEVDADAPYIYRPLSLPSLPADDDAFIKQLLQLMFKSTEPGLAIMKTMMAPDPGLNCAYARFGQAELQKVRDYAQAYIKSRADSGADTTALRRSLGKIDPAMATNVQTARMLCARYRQSGTVQALYDTVNAALTAATARQNPAVLSLNAATAAHDVARKCRASREVLTIASERIIRLELITVLIEDSPQDSKTKAYLAGTRVSYRHTEGVLQQAAAIEATACPAAAVADMALD